MSAQLSAFDDFSMDEKFEEPFSPETKQNVIKSSDESDQEMSAATQSKPIRYFSFFIIFFNTLTKHCLLFFFILCSIFEKELFSSDDENAKPKSKQK